VYASDLASPEGAWRTDLPLVCLKAAGFEGTLAGLGGYGLVVYNIGDHAGNHGLIYEFLQRRPGLIVLHDLVLRHLLAGHWSLVREDGAQFKRLLELCHGPAARRWLRDLERNEIEDVWGDPRFLDYHMARAVVEYGHGVVVHSDFARRRLEEFTSTPVTKVHFPRPPLADEALHWPLPGGDRRGRVRVLTFGILNTNKQVHQVLETIGTRPALRRRVTYTVVGDARDRDYLAQLQGLIEEYDLADVVCLTGPQPDSRLHDELRQAEVVVNLRKPHLGESSWSLLESLIAGKPTVVWDHGYYSEFPDGVVCRVATRRQLGDALERLCGSAELRRRMGGDARAYAVRTFDTAAYCRGLLAAAEAASADGAVLALTDFVAERVAEIALEPTGGPLADRATAEIARLLGDRASGAA
jgi:glycosyltransferase involved in cell wall biosynthesis